MKRYCNSLAIYLLATACLGVIRPERAAAGDRIVLRNGTILSGRVLDIAGDRIRIVLDFGGTIEIPRREIHSLQRQSPSVANDPVKSSRRDRGQDHRFLVYHGEKLVGFRRIVRTEARRRGHRGTVLEEEIVFREVDESRDGEVNTCRVVTSEFRSESGDFRTLFYREGGMGTDTIVDATLRGGQLEYSWFRGAKRTFHREEVDPGIRFPLGFWQEVSALASRADRDSVRFPVWEPRMRAVTAYQAERFPEVTVAHGGRKLRIVPVRLNDPRGPRLRWLGQDGRTWKEYLNGITLLSVRTSRPCLPPMKDPKRRPDREELALVRVYLDPVSGMVIRTPSAGWLPAPQGAESAVFALMNREVRSTIKVFWAPTGADWPGPSPVEPSRVKPARFGGWPGEGWETAASPDDAGIVVRRMQTRAGRVVAVLEAPPDFRPPMLLDFAALLRTARVPGTP
jgi:hypothetical protein